MGRLRFLAALVGACLVHLAGARLAPWFPAAVDPFVVVLVWYASRRGPIEAEVAGTVTGFVQDAFSGGLYGLHAFANTVVGYFVHVASQRVVVGQQGVRVLVFAAASAIQQGVTMLLVLLLQSRPELPALRSVPIKIATTALLGAVVLTIESRAQRQWKGWQRRRSRRLRFR